MGRAFDPEATRRRLLEDSIGLDWQLDQALENAQETLNLFFWHHVVDDVVEARVVGLGDDPRVARMLETLCDVLGPLDWPAQRRRAVSEKPGPGVSLEQWRANALYLVAGGCTALALGRWLQTGEPQTQLFSKAYEAARGSFDTMYAKKTKWRIGDVANVIALGCAGHRFTEVVALFESPALEDYRMLDLPKARSTLELAYAIAQHRVHGTFSAEDLGALCERTLRREVVAAIQLSVADLAKLAYLVGMVRTDGDPRALLDRMIDYVSYLAKAKPSLKRASKPRTRPATTEHLSGRCKGSRNWSRSAGRSAGPAHRLPYRLGSGRASARRASCLASARRRCGGGSWPARRCRERRSPAGRPR